MEHHGQQIIGIMHIQLLISRRAYHVLIECTGAKLPPEQLDQALNKFGANIYFGRYEYQSRCHTDGRQRFDVDNIKSVTAGPESLRCELI